jgi:hypothetical protein
MEIYQLHMGPAALSSLHNSSKKHHAGLVYQCALLPASLLLQPMADSGHRPRKATPLDFGPRPAPPQGEKTLGRTGARTERDPSGAALLF